VSTNYAPSNGYDQQSTPYADEAPIYDEESGELISQERVVYAPTPSGNGNGYHNGNGNGHRNGNGRTVIPSENDVFASLFDGTDRKPTRHIRVYFQRNGNLEADEYRLRQLYGEIISLAGDDTFSIITENGPDDPKLWEFELTTRYGHDLLDRIAALVGENNIVVR
jgi:hypothetical protein